MNKNHSAFWDRVARRYANMKMRNPEIYEETLALTRAHLSPQDNVLELGCGSGTTALKLAKSVGHLTATDYSTEMITIANEKKVEAGINNVAFCVARVCDGSLPSGSFDVAIAFNLLHLLGDRPAAFGEVHERLKPGGLFISKTPCLGLPYRILQPVIAVLRALGKAPSFNFLSTARLERDIENAGFAIIETGDYPSNPPRRFIVAQKA